MYRVVFSISVEDNSYYRYVNECEVFKDHIDALGFIDLLGAISMKCLSSVNPAHVSKINKYNSLRKYMNSECSHRVISILRAECI